MLWFIFITIRKKKSVNFNVKLILQKEPPFLTYEFLSKIQ